VGKNISDIEGKRFKELKKKNVLFPSNKSDISEGGGEFFCGEKVYSKKKKKKKFLKNKKKKIFLKKKSL